MTRIFSLSLQATTKWSPPGAGWACPTWLPRTGTARAGLALKTTRVGQLCQGLAEGVRTRMGEAVEWRGMEQSLQDPLRAGAPELEGIYDSFRENLGELCDAATDANVPIVISTVPSISPTALHSHLRTPSISIQ